jgi:Family of unknown function (DUF5336)
MTFPGGGPGGYPGQGPQQPGPGGYGPPPQQGSPVTGVNLPVLLSLGITLLGLVAYFMGFSEEANGAETQIVLMLVAGLLAAFRVVPNGPKFLPVATVLSVVAALWLLDGVIGIPDGADTPGIIVVLLIVGILQMGVAVVALLFDYGILKVPAPKPQMPYGQYGPPSGGFPQQQPGQYGQTQQYPQQPQPGQYPQQPGQQPPPSTPPGGYPQQG